ncbi:MAG: phosphopantothenoylcysteine decarboxylase domain-containing protein [Pirellulaceae bacterium]
MARILITSGPTRQYLDPVRYLTNASSGRMGRALTVAALASGHEVIVVSGPVQIHYPAAARVVQVISTEEMLGVCCREYPACDGIIATAAPCDYRPHHVSSEKISKTGAPLLLQLLETPDIVAALGASKRPDQWVVGFALETNDQRMRAQQKLEKKSCDLIVLNGPQAIDSETNIVEVMDRRGQIVRSLDGPKSLVAQGIFEIIQRQLIDQS